jgi:hypothetical protein
MFYGSLGALPTTCDELQAALRVKRLELADAELSRQELLGQLEFIPQSEQDTPGTVGYGMKSGLRATARLLGQRRKEIETMCAHGGELGCPCRDLKNLAIVAGVGLVALVGIVWVVRR